MKNGTNNFINKFSKKVIKETTEKFLSTDKINGKFFRKV